MRNMFRAATAAAAILVVAAVGKPEPAQAQWAVACTNCSTTMTQLLGYGKQLQQVETQLQQYATQLRQYANMVQNTTSVPQQIYSNATSDMAQVRNLMTAGSQLSFSNPGASLGTFSSFLNSTANLPNSLTAQANQYAAWSTRAKDGINSAMNAVSAQNSQMSSDNATMQRLQSQAASSTGQMQAMQNGAEISAQGVRETEKLRQLVMLQVQLEANKQANDEEEDAQEQANWQKFRNVTPLNDAGKNY
jgi:type IV secretion system protein TrbJ